MSTGAGAGLARPPPGEMRAEGALPSCDRNPFPLPRVGALTELGEEFVAGRTGRRLLKDVNEAVESLNWLSGARRREGAAGQSILRRELLQHAILRRVARLVADRGAEPIEFCPKEAYEGLLRGRGLYGSASACATLATFDFAKVSLPDDVKQAPFIDDVLPPNAKVVFKVLGSVCFAARQRWLSRQSRLRRSGLTATRS